MQNQLLGMSKAEIAEEIEHQIRILRALRQRLRQREMQEAVHGINTPPEVITEIHELTDRIVRHEEIITSLKTITIENGLTLAEAEYKLILAKAYSTDFGKPSVAGAARIEFERLRLGIDVEKSRFLEKQIREDLIKETCSQINITWPDTFYYMHDRLTNGKETHKDALLAHSIAKVFRLERDIALELIPIKLNKLSPDNDLILYDDLLFAVSYYNKFSPSEYALFAKFVEKLLVRIEEMSKSNGMG